MSDRRRHPQELSRRGVTVGIGVTGRTVSPLPPMFIEQSPATWTLPVTPTTACRTRELRFPLFGSTAGMG